ncbi:MAG: type I DNA topoisomerase [Frankiaceae bacterium]
MPKDRASSAANNGGGRRLVIVESPAKARTIAGYLGRGYVVEPSIGHIRDLPNGAAEIPAAQKKEPWARLGIDVDADFAPLYIVPPAKKAQVAKLKAALKDADELLLATDEDREGEAIAWHLMEVLKPKVPVRRMVFHEITPAAIQAAIDNPRDIDEHLVNAQESRRLLDRLVGYEVSPVLWKKVMPKLSAGRVQSVATRILVERERARMRFVSASYWDLTGTFATGRAGDATDPPRFDATLVTVGGRRLATGRDFAEDGSLKNAAALQLEEGDARGLADRLAHAEFAVAGVEEKPYRRSPYAPFITSTLQQEASRKLRFSSQHTMRVAQRLYENGHITYMRTDSTTLSDTALKAARDQARTLYGPEYVPETPRQYVRKVKNAQEAHEAIRPSGDVFRTPGEMAGALDSDERRLYELIWQRTVASQMADARGQSVRIEIAATSSAGEDVTFAATGKTITFPGFLRAYVEGSDDPEADLEDRERRLPVVTAGDALAAERLEPQGHSTSPPPRFTEATLVKRLEELGVGRPSTYASILGTIQDRGYVLKRGGALVPSFVAFAVVALLEQYFGQLVDYAFTASMEDDLDAIAEGNRQSIEWLTRFYFGSDRGAEGGVARAGGLKRLVAERLGDIDAREINSIPIGETEAGPVEVRVGRYGPYVQRGEEKASVPEDLAPDELTLAKAEELLSAPSGERELGPHPETGEPIVAKAGRFGPYVTTVPAGSPKSKEKPRTGSLFASMTLDTVTLDDAVRLLTLPRVLGQSPDGVEITAQNGRYGPYVKKDSDSRSLESEDQLFTVTLDEALALFAQPKPRRGARAADAPPLKELGPDPVSGAPMVVKEGRFGPYVTDGQTNASLRKGDSIEELTTERAAELMAARRERDATAPPKAKRTARATRPKTTRKASTKR